MLTDTYASLAREIDSHTGKVGDGLGSHLTIIIEIRHSHNIILTNGPSARNSAGVRNTDYLDCILKQHANKSIYLFFRSRFEPLVDVFDQCFHTKNEKGERSFEDLQHLFYMIRSLPHRVWLSTIWYAGYWSTVTNIMTGLRSRLCRTPCGSDIAHRMI